MDFAIGLKTDHERRLQVMLNPLALEPGPAKEMLAASQATHINQRQYFLPCFFNRLAKRGAAGDQIVTRRLRITGAKTQGPSNLSLSGNGDAAVGGVDAQKITNKSWLIKTFGVCDFNQQSALQLFLGQGLKDLLPGPCMVAFLRNPELLQQYVHRRPIINMANKMPVAFGDVVSGADRATSLAEGLAHPGALPKHHAGKSAMKHLVGQLRQLSVQSAANPAMARRLFVALAQGIKQLTQIAKLWVGVDKNGACRRWVDSRSDLRTPT